MNDAVFSQLDFGPLSEFLKDDNVTDISYTNGGQVWLKTLDKGVYQVDRPEINNALMEKLAFQCANVMGKTFNMAHPMLDAESAELRLNFIHDSIATNGIACVIRKTPAKIRLNKEKLLNEKYVTASIHEFLMKCVEGHANIIVSGETGSGKTELVKYLASHIKENEKIINKGIKKVSEDIENLKYNTAVSTLMTMLNEFNANKKITKKEYRIFLQLLNPIIPHITEELNEKYNLGEELSKSLLEDYDESKIIDETFTMVVQVNGKVRGKIEVNANTSDDEMKELAKSIENVKNYIDGKEIVKEVIVPKKLVSIVVK